MVYPQTRRPRPPRCRRDCTQIHYPSSANTSHRVGSAASASQTPIESPAIDQIGRPAIQESTRSHHGPSEVQGSGQLQCSPNAGRFGCDATSGRKEGRHFHCSCCTTQSQETGVQETYCQETAVCAKGPIWRNERSRFARMPKAVVEDQA